MDKSYKYILNGIKFIILLLTGFYLYKQLSGIEITLNKIPFPIYLICSIILCPINWMLEAKKWQTAIVTLQPIDFYQSLKAVLTGIATGFITPGNLGDYPGRVMYLEKQNRLTGTFLTFCSRATQMYVTSFVGIIVTILFYIFFVKEWYLLVVIFGSFSIVLLYSFFFFHYDYLYQKLLLFPKGFLFFKKIIPKKNYFYLIREKLLLYSLCRYLVIILQFVLIFKSLGTDIDFNKIIVGAILVMLIKSFVPVFKIFNDLGVREAATVLIFNYFFISPVLSITASVFLWLINIVIPLFAGIYFVTRFK